MKYIIALIMLLVCSTASAWDYYPRAQSGVLRVMARSYYSNPYFRANSYYEPRYSSEGYMQYNPYSKEAEMGQPPKPLLDIVTPGTYTITSRAQ